MQGERADYYNTALLPRARGCEALESIRVMRKRDSEASRLAQQGEQQLRGKDGAT